MNATVCTGELAGIVGGELVLGSLPPLGGRLEPVSRIVTDLSQLGEGDVFWALNPDVPADWAFASHALGVISSRPVEPWAGRFAIHVQDNGQALARVADWAVRMQPGNRIFVIENEPTTSSLIHQFLSTRLVGQLHCGATWPLDLLGVSSASDFIVVAINDSFLKINGLSDQSHLCSSDILVISSLANHEWETRDPFHKIVADEVSQLPSCSWLILNGDEAATFTLASQANARVMFCGEKAHCSVRAQSVCQTESGVRFELDNQAICHRGSNSTADLLAAIAVAQAINWTDAEICDAMNGLESQFASQL